MQTHTHLNKNRYNDKFVIISFESFSDKSYTFHENMIWMDLVKPGHYFSLTGVAYPNPSTIQDELWEV